MEAPARWMHNSDLQSHASSQSTVSAAAFHGVIGRLTYRYADSGTSKLSADGLMQHIEERLAGFTIIMSRFR